MFLGSNNLAGLLLRRGFILDLSSYKRFAPLERGRRKAAGALPPS